MFQTSSVASPSALYIYPEKPGRDIATNKCANGGNGKRDTDVSRSQGSWWHRLAEPSHTWALPPAASSLKKNTVDQVTWLHLMKESHGPQGWGTRREGILFILLPPKDQPQLSLSKPFTGGKCTESKWYGHQWLSVCHLCPSSSSSTRELIRNANSQALPHIY